MSALFDDRLPEVYSPTLLSGLSDESTAMEYENRRRSTTRRLALIGVKSVHTLIWMLVEAAVGYLLFAGATRRSDRRTVAAGVVVVVESTAYLANGARCPLTGLAESLGAENGAVTDIFLPKWLARNLPLIHVPLLALVIVLHGKTFTRSIGARTG